LTGQYCNKKIYIADNKKSTEKNIIQQILRKDKKTG